MSCPVLSLPILLAVSVLTTGRGHVLPQDGTGMARHVHDSSGT